MHHLGKVAYRKVSRVQISPPPPKLKKVIKKIILLNKKEGETPLEALENFRFKNKEYKDVKMTYAGRLDPMASGILLILAGDEIKNKEKSKKFYWRKCTRISNVFF